MKRGAAQLIVFLAVGCLRCFGPTQINQILQGSLHGDLGFVPTEVHYVSGWGWQAQGGGKTGRTLVRVRVSDPNLDSQYGQLARGPASDNSTNWSAGTLAASPSPKKRGPEFVRETITKTYDVRGKTFDDVSKNAHAVSGISSPDGERMAGGTQSGISLDLSGTQTQLCGFEGVAVTVTLKLTAARVTVKTVITLPKWTGQNEASQQDREWWANAVEELRRHEIGHLTISWQQARKLQLALSGITVSAVAPTSAKATDEAEKKLTSEIRDRLDRIWNQERAERQREYDELTDHGRKQHEARK
jgi:predicted secreted Zn-dependent protease